MISKKAGNKEKMSAFLASGPSPIKIRARDTIVEISQQHIFKVLFKVIELSGPDLARHSRQVAIHSQKIAGKMGFNLAGQRGIYLAGLLHDIGKIGMKEILVKPEKLNEQEWLKIKEHPRRGYDVLLVVPGADAIGRIVLYHHERYDGKGYPDGLSGEEIPVESRILAVADAFDAMTEERSYRSRLVRSEAIEELLLCAGSQFDSFVVEAFCEVLRAEKMI